MRPSTFKARTSASKRTTKGYKTPVMTQIPGRRTGLRSGVTSLVRMLHVVLFVLYYFCVSVYLG